MARKLGKMERRAVEACEQIKADGYGSFVVDWTKSATWGRCARILWHGDKAAHAGGCGYDKLSAVLAEFLHPLIAGVGGTGGAGLRTVQEKCAASGWELTHDYDAKQEDGFTITRKSAPLPYATATRPHECARKDCGRNVSTGATIWTRADEVIGENFFCSPGCAIKATA